MKVLLTGKNGQLGWELERTLAPLGEVIATDRVALDLADPGVIRRVVREVKPQVIVNAGAYTAVEKAESEPALAMRINGTAPRVLAEEAKRLGALLVHYSTDYVFDGTLNRPYQEDDVTNAINEYGRTKLVGESAIRDCHELHLILRTSWVYSARGKNFLTQILKLADDLPELRVVDDQFGAPTWARHVAEATSVLLARTGVVPSRLLGTYHLAAEGATSWYGFASAIISAIGLPTSVVPISTSEYSTSVRRPANSKLDCRRMRTECRVGLPDWRTGLHQCLDARTT